MHTPFKHSDSPLGSAHVRPPANADPLVDAATVAAAPRLRGRRFDLAEVKAALKALAQPAVQS